MKSSDFSCYYHPVTVIFLDDSKNFLDSLEFEFGNKLQMLTFEKSSDAIKLLKQEENMGVSINQSNLDSDEVGQYAIDFNINDIHKIIYDIQRFSYVAVAVIDYDMPDMDGIEFCRTILDKQVYKILLTAKADNETAVKAFNDGLIDKFILKPDKNLCDTLIKTIDELKNRYFINLSKPIMFNLEKHLQDLFNKKEFKKILNQIISDCQAIEYYLIDKSGSFLFLDKHGNPTWLIIRSDKDFDEHILMLEGFDALNPLLAPLRKREKLLFLLSEEEYKQNVQNWGTHTFTAKPLLDNYYYAIVNGKITNAITWENVKPYTNLAF